VKTLRKTCSRQSMRPVVYVALFAATIAAAVFCVCAGSVDITPKDTFLAIWNAVFGKATVNDNVRAIILFVRLPRVLAVGLVGAALSLCGAAMQGLLRNPLADGSTLGVSSGASLGAVLAIALGITLPGFPLGGTMVLAMMFAFLSLCLILFLSFRIDRSLSTNTIILIGVVFSMFASSAISLIIASVGEKAKTITFWTMGSLAGSNYADVLTLLAALILCGAVLMRRAAELNALALGEENARNIGVDVRRVKLTVMIAVSVLIGVCVSAGGTIAFVGLVVPHMTRALTGPNHKVSLPVTMFFGAMFLMLCDLVSRIIVSPRQLPVGVVTSFIGAILFVYIFGKSRRAK
jgi:iron complex transport system permease protein